MSLQSTPTAQQMKFSIKDFFFSKRDQIRSFLRLWSHLMKKFLMENFLICAVTCQTTADFIVSPLQSNATIAGKNDCCIELHLKFLLEPWIRLQTFLMNLHFCMLGVH